MDVPYIEICRREEFCASRRLHNPALSDEENRGLYGVCNNPNGHGHDFVLEVVVGGPVPERTGLVMDFVRLGQLIDELVLQHVDHKHLNLDVDFLAGVNPSSENLVRAFWERLDPSVGAYSGCQLRRIRLYEGRGSYVEYRGVMTSPSAT